MPEAVHSWYRGGGEGSVSLARRKVSSVHHSNPGQACLCPAHLQITICHTESHQHCPLTSLVELYDEGTHTLASAWGFPVVCSPFPVYWLI